MSEIETHWHHAPIMLDVLTPDGRILYANATQERILGHEAGALNGTQQEKLYPKTTRALLQHYFAEAARGRAVGAELVRIKMRGRDRRILDLAANIEVVADPQHGAVMRLAKIRLDPLLERLERTERENEVLSSIISAARDATYCIEFVEPVDLTAPEHEVIRQVFENRCFWRYCNDGMARLYRLPPGEDLNQRNVREVFPRNPDNEAFVRQLIEQGWHVDGAASRDHRYDGLDMYVENDVRAHIQDGKLLRFWGTVRDTSSRRLKERQLINEASQALDLLGAIPDPILVVNEGGRIEGANPAAEWCFGWSLDQVLGAHLESFLAFDASPADLVSHARPGPLGQHRRGIAICRDGRRAACEANVAAIAESGAAKRVVMTLRVLDGDRVPKPRAVATRAP
jgi:PAS domain S-box-containing protein